MLISPELAAAFNQQIGNELGASLQYVSIAAHFHQKQLTLLSKLFMEQAEAERAHAMKFVKYVLDTKGDLRIPSIASRAASALKIASRTRSLVGRVPAEGTLSVSEPANPAMMRVTLPR